MLSKVAGAIFGPGNDFSALALFQYSCLAIHVFWFIFFPWFLSISDALGSHCSGYGEVLGLCLVAASQEAGVLSDLGPAEEQLSNSRHSVFQWPKIPGAGD